MKQKRRSFTAQFKFETVMALLRPAILEQVRLRGGDVEATERVLGSEAADMLALLDYIETQYGQVTDYVQALGLNDAQIERLRARLLDLR